MPLPQVISGHMLSLDCGSSSLNGLYSYSRHVPDGSVAVNITETDRVLALPPAFRNRLGDGPDAAAVGRAGSGARAGHGPVALAPRRMLSPLAGDRPRLGLHRLAHRGAGEIFSDTNQLSAILSSSSKTKFPWW